jgi:hypothetical protein
LQQQVGGAAVVAAQRLGELAEKVKDLFSPVNVDIVGEAGVVEQVVHGNQARLFLVELGNVGLADQGLKVREGDGFTGVSTALTARVRGRRDTPRQPQWPSPRQVRKKAYLEGSAAVLIL